MQTVRFSKEINQEFTRTLKQRVRAYFKENNLSMHGNYKMYLKTAFMFSLLIIPYFFNLFTPSSSFLLHMGLWALMGFGVSGIGLSVMHDANHGAYSNKKWLNQLMGNSMTMIGASQLNWKIKHNILHHTYTNVDGLDGDIDAPSWLLRFSPHGKKYKIHRFQHIYAWILYALQTLFWTHFSDFTSFLQYKKDGLFRLVNHKPAVAFAKIMGSKTFYMAYILVLPLLFSAVPWWQTVLGYVLMHMITGFMLSIIFQPAHVMESAEFPIPEAGKLDQSREIHQLLTTTNFAPKNKILTWYAGGLNFQIEHHLFPNICHIHYPQISKIIKETVAEFKLPYHEIPSFRRALIEHGKMLQALGT